MTRKFKNEVWALLFDSRFQEFRGKFHTRWLGPYEIDEVFQNGVFQLIPRDGKRVMLVNDHHLKMYHKPTSKEEFVAELQNRVEHFLMEDIPSIRECTSEESFGKV